MDKGTMEREGWHLATTTSEQDLRRILEMYHELGIDVYTEKVAPEECGECTACYIAGNETLYRIYTRAKGETLFGQE
jgi:hypothetical protein